MDNFGKICHLYSACNVKNLCFKIFNFEFQVEFFELLYTNACLKVRKINMFTKGFKY